MSTDYKRLSNSDLVEELSELEQRLAGGSSKGRLKALVQNLRIHQVELEMQNRELREAQQALEEARDRYADLYDFAPVGYMSLNSQGVIQSINLTGASMLGRPRGQLQDSPFSMRVEAGDVPAFFKHLSKALHGDGKAVTELVLRSDGGEALWVRLESALSRSDGATVCRTAMIDVTQQRKTDQSRRESEARLGLIADNVPVLIAYVDASRRFVFNNAAYERWFGHSRDYIHGRHVRDVLGQEAYDTLRPYIDAALAGDTAQFETEVPYRDAGARYVSGSYIPHRDSSGDVVGFFGLVNDLSERRRADKALAEERNFVSAVLDTAGALVVVMDREGRIVRFNRECERVTGYSAAEVVGRRFDMFLLPGERIEVEDVFGHLSGGGFPLSFENHWLTRHGEARLIAWSNTALTGADGRGEHVIATGIDVTERRRTEDELRQSERQLKLITDAVPVLISYVDRELRYHFANAAYGEWLGVEPSQMIGRRLDELIEEDAMATLRPFTARALAGEEVSYENVLTHRRLGPRDVSMNLVPDCDQDGVVHGYFSVALDITDRKRRESSDKRRLLEYAHADRLSTMGGMTTEIAHELNQPLTAIATTADICVRRAAGIDGGRDDMLAESLSEISSQAHRAAGIVKHLRDFARRREPEFAPVAVERVIARSLSLIHIEADANRVAVRAVHPSRAMVEADAVLIEQVIVNLARNAIQAMSAAGTERPRLMLATEAAGEHIELVVFDNGPGLPDEVLAHMFEPFQTTRAEGMGLGLAICRTIVEAHGGEIRGENRPAGGAVFRIRLRRLDDSEQDWRAAHD